MFKNEKKSVLSLIKLEITHVLKLQSLIYLFPDIAKERFCTLNERSDHTDLNIIKIS